MAARKDTLPEKLLDRLRRTSIPLQAATLAEQFGKRTSNVSNALKSLEAKGLVKRADDAERNAKWIAVKEAA